MPASNVRSFSYHAQGHVVACCVATGMEALRAYRTFQAPYAHLHPLHTGRFCLICVQGRVQGSGLAQPSRDVRRSPAQAQPCVVKHACMRGMCASWSHCLTAQFPNRVPRMLPDTRGCGRRPWHYLRLMQYYSLKWQLEPQLRAIQTL